MLVALSKQLNAQFQKTNERLATNAQVYLDTRGGWHLHRYQADDSLEEASVRLLYPTARVISLRDVLSQVNKLTGFLGKFVHKGFRQKPTSPDERLLLYVVK